MNSRKRLNGIFPMYKFCCGIPHAHECFWNEMSTGKYDLSQAVLNVGSVINSLKTIRELWVTIALQKVYHLWNALLGIVSKILIEQLPAHWKVVSL